MVQVASKSGPDIEIYCFSRCRVLFKMSRKRKLDREEPEAGYEARALAQARRVQANCAERARLLPLMVGRALPAKPLALLTLRGLIYVRDTHAVLRRPGR